MTKGQRIFGFGLSGFLVGSSADALAQHFLNPRPAPLWWAIPAMIIGAIGVLGYPHGLMESDEERRQRRGDGASASKGQG